MSDQTGATVGAKLADFQAWRARLERRARDERMRQRAEYGGLFLSRDFFAAFERNAPATDAEDLPPVPTVND